MDVWEMKRQQDVQISLCFPTQGIPFDVVACCEVIKFSETELLSVGCFLLLLLMHYLA